MGHLSPKAKIQDIILAFPSILFCIICLGFGIFIFEISAATKTMEVNGIFNRETVLVYLDWRVTFGSQEDVKDVIQ